MKDFVILVLAAYCALFYSAYFLTLLSDLFVALLQYSSHVVESEPRSRRSAVDVTRFDLVEFMLIADCYRLTLPCVPEFVKLDDSQLQFYCTAPVFNAFDPPEVN